MKISNKINYPYPVWGWSDDYVNNEVDYDVRPIASDANSINYELELLSHNVDIEKLIPEKACHICVIECSQTFYHKVIYSDHQKFSISIPRVEVSKGVECKWMIVSKEEILDFKSDSLHSDYSGGVLFPKGAMLAYITSFTIQLQFTSEQHSLGDIFVVKRHEGDDVDFVFDNPKITILMPKMMLDQFDACGDQFSYTMLSTFYRQALEMACSRITEYSEQEWYMVLEEMIDAIPEEEGILTPEELSDGGYDMETCHAIADYIFRKPEKEMLKNLCEVTEKLNGL